MISYLCFWFPFYVRYFHFDYLDKQMQIYENRIELFFFFCSKWIVGFKYVLLRFCTSYSARCRVQCDKYFSGFSYFAAYDILHLSKEYSPHLFFLIAKVVLLLPI